MGVEFLKQTFGKELEHDLLGEDVQRAARWQPGDPKPRSFEDALSLVKANQRANWNPEDPPVKPTSFPNDLHYMVQEALASRAEALAHGRSASRALIAALKNGKLKLYNSLGSFIDSEGIDCFFTFGPEPARPEKRPLFEIRVTVDVTENHAKKSGYKADEVIYFPVHYDALKEEKKNIQFLAPYAEEIATKIVDRASRVAREAA